MKPLQRIAPRQLLTALVFLLVGFLCLPVFAQEASLVALKTDGPELSPAAPAPVVSTPAAHIGEQHRFWDTKNRVLFAAVAASSTADFAVTRANLQEGGRELNPVTRLFGTSTAGLALNFAGETAGVIGISYFFHKTGHHKMERWISIVNVGSTSAAVGYDLAHR